MKAVNRRTNDVKRSQADAKSTFVVSPGALRGPEVNYTAMEKLVLALINPSKTYYQTQSAGRMQSGVYNLGEFGKHYRPKRPEEEGPGRIPQRKKNRSRHGGPCSSQTGHLALTKAEQRDTHGSGRDERAGRKSKPEFGGGNKSKAGQGQQELDREIVSSPFGAPTHNQKPLTRDTQFTPDHNRTEAVNPAEILLEEKREQAAIAEAKSKRQMEKYYNAKVRNTRFKPGDFVYRSNEASRAEDTRKLGPKWEGPYEVTGALRKGSYRLKDRNGKELPRAWNVCNLKKSYIHKM
ncbi:hypothetical protein Tco_0564249 [Tanacetum coccineum]